MPRPPELYQWQAQIANHFPGLSQPMVMGLALWSLGMIVVRSCSLSAIAAWWWCRLNQPFQTGREACAIPTVKPRRKRACIAPSSTWVRVGRLG